MALPRPVFQWETISGEPWLIEEKEIVPLVRVISVGWVGANGGWLFRSLKPVAVVETTRFGSRRIPITDPTDRWLAVMGLAAMLPLARKLLRRRG